MTSVVVEVDPLKRAAALAASMGVVFDRVTPLRSTNNLVAWLEPSAVVARVGTDPAAAAREVALAARLQALGAAVVRPADEIPAEAYPLGDGVVTFWRYHPQEAEPVLSDAAIAVALRTLHDSLLEAVEVVTVAPRPADVAAALAELEREHFAPELRPDDRQALRDVLLGGDRMLSGHRSVLHGSPHRHNILSVDGQPRFIDFETVCRGPIEWDLAHLEQPVADAYPRAVDHDLLAQCRVLVSAVTAVWCWGSLDRGPDMRAHADHHLSVVLFVEGKR